MLSMTPLLGDPEVRVPAQNYGLHYTLKHYCRYSLVPGTSYLLRYNIIMYMYLLFRNYLRTATVHYCTIISRGHSSGAYYPENFHDNIYIRLYHDILVNVVELNLVLSICQYTWNGRFLHNLKNVTTTTRNASGTGSALTRWAAQQHATTEVLLIAIVASILTDAARACIGDSMHKHFQQQRPYSHHQAVAVNGPRSRNNPGYTANWGLLLNYCVEVI